MDGALIDETFVLLGLGSSVEDECDCAAADMAESRHVKTTRAVEGPEARERQRAVKEDCSTESPPRNGPKQKVPYFIHSPIQQLNKSRLTTLNTSYIYPRAKRQDNMASEGKPESAHVPDLLYHTVLTVDEREAAVGKQNPIPRVYVLGTHSELAAAKKFALQVIPQLGYDKSDFDLYEEKTPQTAESWQHGDGIVVYAKAPAGQVFTVGTDTNPNPEKLRAVPDGTVLLPGGVDHLHYVLQTTIDYKADPAISTEIQGAFVRRADAVEAVQKCLVSEEVSPDDYAQYDARDSVKVPDNWPYGEDVYVHAVANTGENYMVTLTTPPSAYLRHGKK
ncbi:hypothetical protein SODALDRAFT_360353 [Sodiomyces alkalinus F11]|uniref:Uncharacterized protein n=1 Tax=Sodiomyces alkalinus (strain CBS 110278 / VKM F-3762 / F11) TaxID=1314773 RepID=A0A3N2PU53_SODAK|nr:hypothetical protein SODALDRAFT_360353 [Sodiomyces alkalinus F11]ROT38030.1 hypothetical protein SODALDRAFT_360353 [Sodiomyces alkalinus F11]